MELEAEVAFALFDFLQAFSQRFAGGGIGYIGDVFRNQFSPAAFVSGEA
jgi:hypothetical protein